MADQAPENPTAAEAQPEAQAPQVEEPKQAEEPAAVVENHEKEEGKKEEVKDTQPEPVQENQPVEEVKVEEAPVQPETQEEAKGEEQKVEEVEQEQKPHEEVKPEQSAQEEVKEEVKEEAIPNQEEVKEEEVKAPEQPVQEENKEEVKQEQEATPQEEVPKAPEQPVEEESKEESKQEPASQNQKVTFAAKIAEADELFGKGRHLEVTRIYKALKTIIENGGYHNPDGSIVEQASSEWQEVIQSEKYLFLTEMIQIYDSFEEKLQDIETSWEKLEIQDASLPEGTNPCVYFKQDAEGILNFISSFTLHWKMEELAAMFLEEDLAINYIKASDRQTTNPIPTGHKNIISIENSIKFPWPLASRWSYVKGVAFMAPGEKNIVQCLKSHPEEAKEFFGKETQEQVKGTDRVQAKGIVRYFKKEDDGTVKFYMISDVVFTAPIPQFMINKLLKSQGGAELLNIAKNYQKIHSIYQQRVDAEPERYAEIRKWFEQ